jgi:hypothetical protein
MQFIGYNTTGSQKYNVDQLVARVDNCNGFFAINTGDCPVRVNDQILYPGTPGTNSGEGMTVGGNLGEVYLGWIKIAFDLTGGGTAPEVSIVQKFYVIDKVLNSQNLVGL